MKDDCTMCSWVKDKFFGGGRGAETKERRKAVRKKLPEGFTAEDIRVESSICTGERTIGFYDKQSKRLRYAELVRSDEDIADYYESYGINRHN